MASNYPGSLDSFDTIASDKKASDSVGGRTHRAMHNDLGDAIEAVQAELGTDPAGGSATVKARFDVIEANDWVTSARIAADAVGSSEIAANAVGASELADNAVDTAAIATGAVTAVKLARQPGNLLSENQAKPTTTGAYTLGGCTEGSPGVYTATITAAFNPYTTVEGISPDDVITASATIAPVGRNAYTAMVFRNAANANIGGLLTGNVISAGSSGVSTITAVAPAGTAKVLYYVFVTGSGAIGNTVTLTNATLHRGAGGQWSLPGVPVPGTGIRPNPANTAEVQIWNDATATWITV